MMVLKHTRVGDDCDHGVCDRWSFLSFDGRLDWKATQVIEGQDNSCVFGYLDSRFGGIFGLNILTCRFVSVSPSFSL